MLDALEVVLEVALWVVRSALVVVVFGLIYIFLNLLTGGGRGRRTRYRQ